MQLMTSPPASLIDAVNAEFSWSKDAKWLPLSGGRTNFAWKLSLAQGDDVVVKLYQGSALNPLFPNDPKSEALLLQELLGKSLAPRHLVSLSTDAGECNVYSHIPGETWQKDTSIVGRLMQTLHSIPGPSELRRVLGGSDALAAKTVSILAECENASRIIAARPEGYVPAAQDLVLLHGDIVPGNLILNETGLLLIDWQCPSLGDPCEDIAVFLSPAMQSLYRGNPLLDTEIGEFFGAYGDQVAITRYQALAPWFHWRMAAYCQWQSEHGRPDYAAARDLELAALQRSRNL